MKKLVVFGTVDLKLTITRGSFSDETIVGLDMYGHLDDNIRKR
jgi:hypothetical protein